MGLMSPHRYTIIYVGKNERIIHCRQNIRRWNMFKFNIPIVLIILLGNFVSFFVFTMGKTRAASSTDSPGADDSQLTNVNDALARQEAMFLKMLDVQQKTSQSCIQSFMDSTNKRFDKFVLENVRTQVELRANLYGGRLCWRRVFYSDLGFHMVEVNCPPRQVAEGCMKKKRLIISVIAVGSHKVAGVRRTLVRRLSQCNIHSAQPCNRPKRERMAKSIERLTILRNIASALQSC